MTTTKRHRAEVLSMAIALASLGMVLAGTVCFAIYAWEMGVPWVAVIMAGFWTAVAIAIAYYKGG